MPPTSPSKRPGHGGDRPVEEAIKGALRALERAREEVETHCTSPIVVAWHAALLDSLQRSCVRADGLITALRDETALSALSATMARAAETAASAPPTARSEVLDDRGAEAIVAVSCGAAHTVLLAASGEAYSCGSGAHGRLGTRSKDHAQRPRPRRMALPARVRVVQISAGEAHTLLRTEGSTALACGDGEQGQLGMGDRLSRDVPTAVAALPRGGCRDVSAGGFHSLFVCVDEGAPSPKPCPRVWSCGDGGSGALGNGKLAIDRLVPEPIGGLSLSPYAPRCVAAGREHSVVALRDGSVWTFGCGNVSSAHRRCRCRRYRRAR